MAGHFKQLGNKSQERVPVAVVMSYLLAQGPDCDTLYFQIVAASEFCCMKPTILYAASCMIDTHSPLAMLCSSLLL